MIMFSHINLWNGGDKTIFSWFINFISINIDKINVVRYNEEPDILLCSCFGDINKVNHIKARIKLFFYGENLERFPPYNNIELLKSTFDIIVGFRYTDKKNKIFRMPLWLHYYPFYNMNDENKNIITFLENEYKKNINMKKNALASLIARHDRGGQRTILLNETQKYGNVLCPSNFNKNCNNITQGNKAKIDFIKNTKYNICPENSKFEGYYTEKIFQAFEGGTIPIYWGIDEPEKDILNKNKYCFIKNINDKSEVERKIKDAIENSEKYLEGNIFNDNAGEVIRRYYDDIVEEIKKLLIIR